jgi:hypothetical protein
MRSWLRFSLVGIAVGMSLWLVGCSKTEDAPAASTAATGSAPAATAEQKPQKTGGVMDITDSAAPSGVKTGVENGKANSAPPK